MNDKDSLPDIWLVEADKEGGWLDTFLNRNCIGIGQKKGDPTWNRFNSALKSDLVWLIPHLNRSGALGIIQDRKPRRNPQYPIWRRRVKWVKIFDQLEEVPVVLQRHKRTQTFTKMRQPWIAMVELYKMVGYKIDYDLLSKEDLIINLQEFLTLNKSADDIEDFSMTLVEYLKGFHTTPAEINQKGFDFVAKKGKQTYYVEVKSSVSFSLDQVRLLSEESKKARIRPWLIVTDFLTDKRKKNMRLIDSRLRIWDIHDIYNEMVENFEALPRNMKKKYLFGLFPILRD